MRRWGAIDEAEARRCFGCHTTASTTAAGFAASRAIPGVTCEACHGPGRAHVSAMERGADRARAAGTILNPRTPRREPIQWTLRRVSRHVLGRPIGWRARHRGAPVATVPAAEQPLLERQIGVWPAWRATSRTRRSFAKPSSTMRDAWHATKSAIGDRDGQTSRSCPVAPNDASHATCPNTTSRRCTTPSPII